MDGSIDISNANNKDIEKLQAGLKKEIKKNRILNEECQKLLENQTILSEALNSREQAIKRLIEENQSFKTQINDQCVEINTLKSHNQIAEIIDLEDHNKICKEFEEKINILTQDRDRINKELQNLAKKFQKNTNSIGSERLKSIAEHELEFEKEKKDSKRKILLRENELKERENRIEITELEIRVKINEVNEKESQIIKRINSLDEKEKDLLKREHLLLEKENGIRLILEESNAKEDSLFKQQQEMDKRIIEIEKIKREINQNSQEIKEKEKELVLVGEEIERKQEEIMKNTKLLNEKQSILMEYDEKRCELEIQIESLIKQKYGLEDTIQKLSPISDQLSSFYEQYSTFFPRVTRIDEEESKISKEKEMILKEKQTIEDIKIKNEKLLKKNAKIYQKLEKRYSLLDNESKSIIDSLYNQLVTLQKQCNTKKNDGSNMEDSLSYLKKILIQFFMQNDCERGSIIPVILRFVGCDEKQILIISKRWKEEKQLVNKKLWVF